MSPTSSVTMRLVIVAAVMAGMLGMTEAQSMQQNYVIGGTTVIFAFTRQGNVTSANWPSFAAMAASDGSITSGSTDYLPTGYAVGATYSYGVNQVMLCKGPAACLAAMQLQTNPPAVTLLPILGNATNWGGGATVVFQAGSAVYVNV